MKEYVHCFKYVGGGWKVDVNRFRLFDTEAKFVTCFPKNGMRNGMLLRDLGLYSLIGCGLLNVLPIWRYMKSMAHLKVLARVTRNAADRRASVSGRVPSRVWGQAPEIRSSS
ncbi:hypothetical protein CEXT_442941 [Caerostris extrusa]|uniref:Uncharacterized protein n=1 Tax=Caerostris extrusa TaxID=172846 RepID=A0AAV4NNC1_CAEEX|nr:hypothetical protein CEXT_442941 [Caerostris extrusa]